MFTTRRLFAALAAMALAIASTITPARAFQIPLPGLPPIEISLPPELSSQLPPVQLPEIPAPPAPPLSSAQPPAVPTFVGGATIHGVHGRTALAVVTDLGIAATPNGYEARPGLSIVKLLLADYAIYHGDGAPHDWVLAERAVRASDDHAATQLFHKYPHGIDTIARAHGMSATNANGYWGHSTTSAVDVARYLHNIHRLHPQSEVLKWMRESHPVAADGTRQDWGTVHLPRVLGTKWGWSDYGPNTVASASYGDSYAAAAFTWGGPAEQNVDVPAARPFVG